MNNTPKHLLLALFAPIFLQCSSNRSSDTSRQELIEKGQALFSSTGCYQCHSLDGQSMYGPSLNEIIGTKATVWSEGKNSVVEIDRDYIRRSIKEPDLEKLAGFEDRRMPKPTLTDEQIDALVEYLVSINGVESNAK